MKVFKPSLDIIIDSLFIEWQKQTLETVFLGSFVAASVLRLVASSIELGSIRGRLPELQDVPATQSLAWSCFQDRFRSSHLFSESRKHNKFGIAGFLGLAAKEL